ncbi:MAG: PAS domain-containing protein [Nitrospirae bacterium]|nr:PAS domain-containing protein [Nitrospirota bacterium]
MQQAHAKIERLENIQEIYAQENAINVTIIENITTGVWVTDEDDVICYANKGMSKIAGVPANKIVGRHVLTEFPEETLKHFRSYYLKAKEELSVIRYKDIHVR